VNAEWWKIRSVRSTYYVLGVVLGAVVVAALLAWYAGNSWDHATPERRGQFSLGPMSELVAWVAQMLLAVLGVLAITSEYSTGMIRTSLTAVPRRGRLLAAKAAVVAAVALVVGEAATFVAFFASRQIIGNRPMRFYTSSVASQLPLLLALGLSVMVFALVGLGLGVVLRSTAGAIVTVAALWYLLPAVASFLPAPWNERLASLMLMSLPRELAGEQSAGVAQMHGVLSPWGALAVLAGYVALPLGAAALALRRRDA
jgi:ABC-2 type transport system permease protein